MTRNLLEVPRVTPSCQSGASLCWRIRVLQRVLRTQKHSCTASVSLAASAATPQEALLALGREAQAVATACRKASPEP